MSARRLFLFLAAMHALHAAGSSSPGQSAGNPLPLNGWELLAPLPDPVGFGGMFAGVLGGQLVAGGGSQFRDKPNWLQGEKVFSDRIFTLAHPAAKWVESATRLPAKMGHFASAATADAIVLVGGIGPGGCLKQAWQLRAKAGGGFAITALPDFPRPVGYAAAAVASGRIYVLGGLREPTSKAPSAEAWSLDLSADAKHAAWRREPDIPGPGLFITGVASNGREIYVLGGLSFDADGKATPSNHAYRFNPMDRSWRKLADLPEPRVAPAAPAPLVAGRILLVGGYAEVFPGPQREYPGFREQTLFYDIAGNRWENGPIMPKAEVPNRDSPSDPGPAPMVTAPCTVWQNRAVIVGGEVRASVRTPCVIAWPLQSARR